MCQCKITPKMNPARRRRRRRIRTGGRRRKEMKASRRLAENDIILRGVTVKIQQVAVCGNYENPTNDAKGEDE